MGFSSVSVPGKPGSKCLPWKKTTSGMPWPGLSVDAALAFSRSTSTTVRPRERAQARNLSVVKLQSPPPIKKVENVPSVSKQSRSKV